MWDPAGDRAGYSLVFPFICLSGKPQTLWGDPSIHYLGLDPAAIVASVSSRQEEQCHHSVVDSGSSSLPWSPCRGSWSPSLHDFPGTTLVTHILAEVQSPPWMVHSSTYLGTPERGPREQGPSGLLASSCLEPLDRLYLSEGAQSQSGLGS